MNLIMFSPIIFVGFLWQLPYFIFQNMKRNWKLHFYQIELIFFCIISINWLHPLPQIFTTSPNMDIVIKHPAF